jgi:hypothetical protein
MFKKIWRWFLVSTPWPIDWIVQKAINFRGSQIQERNIFRELDEDTYEIPGMEGITFPIGRDNIISDEELNYEQLGRIAEMGKDKGWKSL